MNCELTNLRTGGNILVIIPAYNEEKMIGEVIDGAKKFANRIVVVNDASTDRTAEIAAEKGAIVLSHLVNLGLGGALRTGLEYARRTNAEFTITFDADGQHCPEDIPKIIQPLREKKAEVVLGVRFADIKQNNVPFHRFVYNTLLAKWATFLCYGLAVSDSQSGLRAFSQTALEKISLRSLRMEVSSEFVGEIKRNNLVLVEVPIQTIYTKYSLSKGQSFFTGIKTFLNIILNRFSE